MAKSGKKTTKKMVANASKGMTQADFGRHVDVSQPRVAQMIAAGTIEVMANGRIDPEIARIQYVRNIRRSPGSEEVRRVAAARARHIEIQNQKQLAKLVEVEDVLSVQSDILGTFRSELAGVPAASTRDLSLRSEIEDQIEAALARCRSSFEASWKNLKEGKPITSDDHEG